MATAAVAPTREKRADFVQTVGRRKTSVARVRITKGQGQMVINDKAVHEYFPGVVMQKMYQMPFALTKTVGQFNTTVKVEGGGLTSQLVAVMHGLSRALSESDTTLRGILKKNGLLTRDARAKERRKYGLAHAARAKKQSPKR
jgi:small subunit ribosomal protein S9